MSEGAIRRIGFVGIGNMGWPMAANLLKAGFAVTVADAVPNRARDFAREVGGQAAAGAAEAAAGADAVITILPTSKHVAAVVEEMLEGLPAGAVVIEMSSGVPGVTRQLAERLAAKGCAMADCPVSGGVPRARMGELAIMAGGETAVLDRIEPVLQAVGTSVHRCGGIGNAQAMKALNNLVSAGGFLIGIEALLIGQKFGLDPALMVDALNSSTGMNNSTQKKFKQFVLSRRFDSGFGLDLMVKDLSIALEVGRESGTPTPFAALCREMWASAGTLLGPGQDHTAVAQLVEQLGGQALGGGNGSSQS
ncbi:NAD(P)-dependent oxidoreductase [Teichococcus aestuarii]|uniref:Hydroxyacid oxidoreductase n=1 Tax=Teichococcus aestuarii TaxID=568898 RepID=A0A2U1V2X4_9PROT|nr:NAD(P)-dependent oxidoreductase [Pseudoroseomonas aestuarii]PWC28234.1 hydroxyacid oxidoreductase [Pseudoroseomonas aestuarii]